jgi:hypothetical protein
MTITQSRTPTDSSAAAGRRVIARFSDGRMLKGMTQDFAPNRETFHIYEGGDLSSKAVEVRMEELKAVLYVKDFEGNNEHRREYRFDKTVGHGRKAEVTFYDGEVVAGFTMGYHTDRPGFFLIPADPGGNNERIYVLNASVESIKWIR